MSAGSANLQAYVRGGGGSYVDSAVFKNPFDGTTKQLAVEGGQVTIDVTANNRRMLDLTLAPEQSSFDFTSVPGGEITVTRTMTYLDSTQEVIPLGVFCVTEQSMDYQADGSLTMTCPDRWWRIQSNGFGAARVSVPANAGWQEIKRLVEGAWPNAAYPFPGWATLTTPSGTPITNPDQSATTKVGSLVWQDGDRNNALKQLLKANSLHCYFDASGLAVLQPIPVLSQSSVTIWTVSPGQGGTLEKATRVRDTSVIHNVIVMSSTASDVVLPTKEVANTHTPSSDPLSSLGPMGRVTLQLSDNYRSVPQMIAAGVTRLSQELSIQQQLSLTVFPNPVLDGYDVISVVLPAGDPGTTQPGEQHLIQSLTIPFAAADSQSILCRSTRPTGDDSV